MTTPSTSVLPAPSPTPDRPWWQHAQFWLVVLLVAAIYLPRLTSRPMRGEDSRRATVTLEMLRTGDWIVPRQQDRPYLSRPPLQSWIIAGLAKLTGDVDYLAIRLPSVMGVLGMVVAVYAASQVVVGRTGALAAGAAMASLPQVIELGRVGETDALFSFFISSSMLIWLYGYLRGWPRGLVWSLGYALAALGTLTKGVQALPYFAGATWLFLLWRRDWRWLLCRGHLLGIAVFLGIFGAWFVPYYKALGWAGVIGMATRDSHDQMGDHSAGQFFWHLTTIPLRIAGSVMPWFMLLVLYLFPAVRRRAGLVRPAVGFVVIALGVAWPTVWFTPTSQNRHFMPLYPMLAVAIAIAVAAVPFSTDDPRVAQWWRGFLGVLSVVMLVAALAVGALAVPAIAAGLEKALVRFSDSGGGSIGITVWTAAPFLVGAVLLAGIAQWASWRVDALHMQAGAISVAAFLGSLLVGPVLTFDMARSVDLRPDIAHLRQVIGDKPLVSYGETSHLFAYYYRAPIAILDFPRSADDPSARVEYFSFYGGAEGIADPKLPFEWEKVGEYCCDRQKREHPLVLIVVGRRLN